MGVRIPWPCLKAADALKQRYFWFFQPLQDSLKVGAHDFIHTADSGIKHKIVHFDFSSFAVKTDRFDYGIEADLIPELETVSEGLFQAINTHTDAVEFMSIYTCREGFTGEAISSDRRIIQAGFFRASLQRNVNFMGVSGVVSS